MPGAESPGVIDIYDQRRTSLRIAVVARDTAPGVGDDWDTPGAYLLLDQVEPDGV